MFTNDYKEEKYNKTFESVYKYLKSQKGKDENYTIKDLQKFLDSLYANEGNDWTGRGEIKDITNSATVAACEAILAEWKNELQMLS